MHDQAKGLTKRYQKKKKARHTYLINTVYILTCNVHSVSRLNLVNKIIVSKKDDSVRRLPCGHILRRLLKFDLKEQWKQKTREIISII